MKTKKAFQRSKSGGVLLMAMLVTLVFSILSIGLYHMSTMNAVEVVYQDHSSQAFWAAETGLLDAVQRLSYDVGDLRSDAAGGSVSFSVPNSTNQIRYDVTVTDSGEGNSTIDHYEFDVVSVGWENGMNRQIRQRIKTQPGFISAIMAPNDITIDANTLVTGPIMVLQDGQIILDDKIPPGQNLEGDYDIIILADDASINGKSSGANEGADYGLVDLPVPDDVPDMPDFSFYQSQALSTNALTNAPPPIVDLGVNGTQYYNVPGGITVEKITGSGMIVNTGNITIDADTSTGNHVSSDVAILSFGSIDVGNQTEFMGNTLIYALQSVEIGTDSYCLGNSAILADGADASGVGITMGGQSEFFGIIFADDGSVIIEAGSGGDNNTRITGTIMSGDSVELNSNSEVIFDPSVFYDGDLLDLTEFFETTAITTKRDWEELSPL